MIKIHTSESLTALRRNELVAVSLKAGATKPHSVKSAILIERILALQAAAQASVVTVAETPAPAAEETAPVIESPAVAVAEAPAEEVASEEPTNVVPFDAEAVQTEIPEDTTQVASKGSDGLFKINRKVFLLQLAAAGKVINGKIAMPILGSVLISFGKQKVKVEATNLDVAVSTQVPAETDGEFSIAVPYSLLSQFVSKCSSEFLMAEHKNHRLFLSDLENRTQIMTLSGAEFPQIPDATDDAVAFELTSNRLIEAIAESMPCASTDATRYILNGLYFDLNRDTPVIVATDGRRLCRVELGADSVAAFDRKTSAGRFIVPSKGARAIQLSLPAETNAKVTLTERRITVRAELNGLEYFLLSKLVEGNFPNYEQVIPKEESYKLNSFSVSRTGMLEMLARLTVLITEKTNRVKMDFTTDKILLTTSSPDRGDGKEEISAKGDIGKKTIEVAVNPQFISQTLEAWQTEMVTISVKDSVSPILLSASGRLAVVMPVRLS